MQSTAVRRPFVYPPPPPSNNKTSSRRRSPSPPPPPSPSPSPNCRHKGRRGKKSRNPPSKKNGYDRGISPSPSPPSSHTNIPYHHQHAPSPLQKHQKIQIPNIPKPSPQYNNGHNINKSNSDSSSIEIPKAIPFSPRFAGSPHDINKDVTMPTIDESQTKSKHDILSKDDKYSGDSMYSSDDDDDDTKDTNTTHPNMPQSPSISLGHLDKAQQYKQFGPTIKLSTDHSQRDIMRYSAAINQQRLSSKFSTSRVLNGYGISHNRGGGIRDSVGVNFILNGMNSNDKGYNSDGSDDSVSMISQSYGAYLFDPHYKTKMNSQSLKGSGLQSWDSERSIVSDSEHLPIANMSRIDKNKDNTVSTVGSMVSTVIRQETDNTIDIMSGFGSNVMKDIKEKTYNNITEFVGDDVIEEDDTYKIHKKDTIDIINGIVNDKEDTFKQQKNIILEDEEIDDDDDDGVVVMKDVYDAYRPQRLYTVDPDEESDDYSISMDDDDDQIENQKVVVPIPDYQDMTIHEIMNDDIMGKNSKNNNKKKNNKNNKNKENKEKNKGNINDNNLLQSTGYHQFQSISRSFDDDDDEKDIDIIISMVDIKPPSQNKITEMNGSTVIQHIKQEALDRYLLQSGDDEYLNTSTSNSDTDSTQNKQNKATQRRMILLQNVNISLKQTIQKQMKQIELLKTENLNIKNEMEQYKLTINNKKILNENENENENEKDNDLNKLHEEILSLKEDLDKTRHKLLQYEIFDENSEFDIQTLLNDVDSEIDNDVDNKKKINWKSIEKFIKLGDKTSIDKLIKFNNISMNDSETINCFKILETATRYNQIDIVHALISSNIGIKLGNKLLSYRYDSAYSGYTILMIAVTNGVLEIANDLLDYYQYNIINYNDKNKIFQYLNMRDRNGVTLLMKACQSNNIKSIQWVLNQYFMNKIQLKTLIEAKDSAGNNIFNGYITTENVENIINEYSPLIQ